MNFIYLLNTFYLINCIYNQWQFDKQIRKSIQTIDLNSNRNRKSLKSEHLKLEHLEQKAAIGATY